MGGISYGERRMGVISSFGRKEGLMWNIQN